MKESCWFYLWFLIYKFVNIAQKPIFAQVSGIFLAMIVKVEFTDCQKVKTLVNDVHANLHIYCGHLEMSLVKNSGGCSAHFLVNEFLKLTNFTVSRVAVNRPCTA